MTPLDGRLTSGHVYTHPHTHTQSAVISALHFLTQCQSAAVILSKVFCSRQFIFWIIFHTAAATKLNHITTQSKELTREEIKHAGYSRCANV